MWRQSHANQAGSRSAGASSGAAPRSDAIVRSPSGPTSETTTPVLPAAGPTSSTPRLFKSAATIPPAAPRRTSQGLEAFEEAPCYREIVEKELGRKLEP